MRDWLRRVHVVLIGASLTIGSCGDSEAKTDCQINVASYDQSCAQDSDCVSVAGGFPVQSGDYCQTMCLCPGAAINMSSISQYVHRDVSATPLGSGPSSAWTCGCPGEPSPACVNGQCTTNPLQSATTHEAGLTLSDGGEAIPPGSVQCGLSIGPFDGGDDSGAPWRWCLPLRVACHSTETGHVCALPDGGPTEGVTICSAPGVDGG